MVIANQTNTRLYVSDGTERPIEPEMRRYVTEHLFDTTHIESKLGSIDIKTEYYVRHITCSKGLIAAESNELDSNGHYVIVVQEA